MAEGNGSSGGVGFCGLLFLLFLALKLCHVVAWSWWIVCLPLLIPFGLGILIGFIFIACGGDPNKFMKQ